MGIKNFRWRGAHLTGVIGLAIGYIAVALLSLKLASVHPSASPVWPPAGLAFGALVAFGRRYAISVFVGGALVNYIVVDYGEGAGLYSLRAVFSGSLIGLGNLLESLVGASLVNRFAGGWRCLDRVGSVFGFVLIGMLVPVISSVFGVTSLALGGVLPTSDHAVVLLTWYTGNVVGIITVAPLVIWLGKRRPLIEGGRVGETIVQLCLMAVLGALVWGYVLPEALEGLTQVYMTIPLFLWAALRLGRPMTMISVLLLSAIAIAGTASGRGAFVGPTPNHSLVYLQIFIGIISVMALAVGALVAELRATNEGLEEAVEERTIRLERLLRHKNDFLSFTVHELQSPLTGLRNLLGLVRCNPGVLNESESGPSKVISEMEKATDSMLVQVRDLLKSQKAIEEVESHAAARENLGELLEDCVRAHRPIAVAKDIAIEIELPDRPLYAETVRYSIEHILGNLISNAVKFSPAGGIVRARLSGDELSACFEIEDEGPGVPEEQVPRLFERFQRSAAKPTGGESSNGLGLLIVGRMVRELGGKIRYQSGAGKGACFIFELPAESSLGDPPR